VSNYSELKKLILREFHIKPYSSHPGYHKTVGIMAKVLSLMATHSDDRSLYFLSAAEIDDQLSNIEEKKKDAGSQFIRCVPAGTLCKIRV